MHEGGVICGGRTRPGQNSEAAEPRGNGSGGGWQALDAGVHCPAHARQVKHSGELIFCCPMLSKSDQLDQKKTNCQVPHRGDVK
jgi:hypothetical protein